MSEFTPQQPTASTQISVAEYLRLVEAGALGEDDRVELIGGVVVAVMPPGPTHATVMMIAAEALQRAVGSRAAVRTQLPLALGIWSMPAPDVAVVPGSLLDYIEAHAAVAWLVVEVSDSSLAQDRLSKSRIYAAAGIPEYWIVNLRDRSIEVRRDPDVAGAVYRSTSLAARGDSIDLVAIPGVCVAVNELLPFSR